MDQNNPTQQNPNPGDISAHQGQQDINSAGNNSNHQIDLSGSGSLNLGGNINSLYGGFGYEDTTQQPDKQREETYLPPEKTEAKTPEILKPVEKPTIPQIQTPTETKEPETAKTPQKIANTKPHIEDKTTDKIDVHKLQAAPDPVTRFADKDEEEYITGIVEHHEHK